MTKSTSGASLPDSPQPDPLVSSLRCMSRRSPSLFDVLLMVTFCASSLCRHVLWWSPPFLGACSAFFLEGPLGRPCLAAARASVFDRSFLLLLGYATARRCSHSQLSSVLHPCADVSCGGDLRDGRSVVFSDTPRNCGAVLMGVSCAGLSCDFSEVAGEIRT